MNQQILIYLIYIYIYNYQIYCYFSDHNLHIQADKKFIIK